MLRFVGAAPSPLPKLPPPPLVAPPPEKPPENFDAVQADERLASLKRSYHERLAAMANAFRQLPQRIDEDDAMVSLKLADAPEADLAERAWDIFGEALASHQEHTIKELQGRLSEKEAETAKLAAQLSTLVHDQRNGTDERGLKLKAAETELIAARRRLVDLEEFYRTASGRDSVMSERMETLEEETLHWRQRAHAGPRSHLRRAVDTLICPAFGVSRSCWQGASRCANAARRSRTGLLRFASSARLSARN